MARRQDSRILTKQLQGWQVQVVVMKMRNEDRIDVARWGVEHMCVAVHQTSDSWPQEWIGQQAGAAHLDHSCRMSKEVNSRHDGYGSGG